MGGPLKDLSHEHQVPQCGHTEWTVLSPPSLQEARSQSAQHHLPLVSRRAHHIGDSPAHLHPCSYTFQVNRWTAALCNYMTIFVLLLSRFYGNKKERSSRQHNCVCEYTHRLFHGKIKSPRGNKYTFCFFPISQQNCIKWNTSDDAEQPSPGGRPLDRKSKAPVLVTVPPPSFYLLSQVSHSCLISSAAKWNLQHFNSLYGIFISKMCSLTQWYK